MREAEGIRLDYGEISFVCCGNPIIHQSESTFIFVSGDRDPISTLTVNDSGCVGIANEEEGFAAAPNKSADSDGDGTGGNSDLNDLIEEDANEEIY